MKPQNILYIMSDEHNPKMLGCYGHDQVQTPNLDKLAEQGTRFTNAYTNSPICIPARAAFATGRYTHETRYWDNAHPYDGKVRSWGHRLHDEGMRVESIGKLHYRGVEEPTGFDKQTVPMHVMGGFGQIWGSVRDPLPPSRPAKMLGDIGPGYSKYNEYDRAIADNAKTWLADAAKNPTDRPWVLYLGFVAPHFPLTVPQEYYDLYPLDSLPERKMDLDKGYVQHPWIKRMDDFQQVDRHLTADEKQMAVAAYFGLCTYVDALIGEVLRVLDETNLTADTRIIYTSDHGDNVGARGLWGKSNMYEEASGIPLIVTGEDVPVGKTCNTPVSLLDSYQTILQGTDLSETDEEQQLTGKSWFEIASAGDDAERIVFGEYHASGSPSAGYMIRRGRYKYNHYVGYTAELFDLEADPEEANNLAGVPDYAVIEQEYLGHLNDIVDPDAADRMAKDDQNALADQYGGPEEAFKVGTKGATPAPV